MSVQPHPDFSARFTDPIYSASDTLPFDTDEGADLLAEWEGRLAELRQSPYLRTILGADPTKVARAGAHDEETADDLVTAAFIILRFTGTLDDADRDLTVAVLRRLAHHRWSRDEYAIMLRDLKDAGNRGSEPGPARPAPWLVFGGSEDRAFSAWLHRLAKAIMADPAWHSWHEQLPVQQIGLVPMPTGPAHGWMYIARPGETIITVTGSTKELIAIVAGQDANVGVESLHKLTPEAPELLRDLVLKMLHAAATSLGTASPPEALPGSDRRRRS